MKTYRIFLFLVLSLAITSLSHAQNLSDLRYDIGSPTVTDYYIDPTSGRDTNTGRSQSSAFKTLTHAWNVIPQNHTLTTGYRINILPGTLPESALPNYLENRYGTFQAPIIIRALNGRGTVILGGDLNVFDTRYLYLLDLLIQPSPAGDAFHCEKCSYILIRNNELSGGNRAAHETVKVNQSDHIYIEDSNIHGADDNAIDFVAVQYGHVARNRIHDAQDWCEYAKGGSAYLRIEGNEIYDCGTGGFTAGQGTGLEFMTSPWIHYEAYDLKIINNIIHDTEGAGLGVNGGYNILMAHNTLYRIGSRSHTIEIVFGARSCDGNSSKCQSYLDLGGWGTAQTGGDVSANIGNQNVFIYNNLIYNPSTFSGAGQHFAIYGPQTPLSGSNVPGPVTADTNLQVKGNVIFNKPGSAGLGLDGSSGCQPSNPTCNDSQITAENTINTVEPQLINTSINDFRPTGASNILSAPTVLIPPFPGGDRISPPLADEGMLDNTFTRDRSEATRSNPAVAGAYASADSSITPPGGDQNSDTDAPPSITKAKCSPQRVSLNRTIACEVKATDDKGIARVTIESNTGKIFRIKKSGRSFKGTIHFRKKGRYLLTARVTDSTHQITTKSAGKVTVFR